MSSQVSQHQLLKKAPGYTLVELLVSVLIFSGIIVLAIAAFARSVNSGTRSNSVRAQVEAARSTIDQLTNDLHYADMTDQVSTLDTTCAQSSPTFIGVRLGGGLGCDEAELLLKYPGATGSGDLVWRLYASQTIGNPSRASVYVYELRGLSVCNSVLMSGVCPGTAPQVPATPADLLSANYVADGLGGLTPVFSGLDVLSSQTQSPQVMPYVVVNLTAKPRDDASVACSGLAAGVCYTLKTTIIPGST